MKPTGQKPFYYYLFFVLMLLGCENVVDQELDMLEDGISAAYSPQNAIVGDSLTVSGRLQLDQSPVITLGGVEADYVHKGTESRDDGTTKATYSIETIRFLVTPEMGEGRQPLEIQSDGDSQTLYVDILSWAELDSRPDTTLVVEELYRGSSGERYEFQGRSVTADGVIYLQTPQTIYRYQEGQLQPLLTPGDPLTIDGQQVHVAEYDPTSLTISSQPIESFSGVAASQDNQTLYISIYTDMTISVDEELYTGAWMLLKTNPDLNNIEVLNRTFHRTDTTWITPTIGHIGHHFYPSDQLDNGLMENTKLRAQQLHVDAQNRLLFNNNSYYARLETNGRITSFANSNTYYTPDGTQAFIIGPDPGGSPSGNPVTLFDLELMEVSVYVPAKESWGLISFEENPEWQFEDNSRIFDSPNSGGHFKFLGLPNGELLSLKVGPSIGAINPAKTSIYTFAGIEKGYGRRSDAWVPEQNQETGLAKYVNFDNFELSDGSLSGAASFIGVDKRNNVYFLRGGVEVGNNIIPLRIYRLGKP